MSQNQFSKSKALEKSASVSYGWITFAIISVFIVFASAVMLASPLGPAIRNLVSWLFALDATQSTTWYITRSAGIMAYLLLWLSTLWGLAISSKIIDRLLHRSFTFDFHQFISLLALGFLGLHVFILLADQYLPYSLAQILVPYLSPYRPFWVGIGVIAFYISILVTVTFYVRQKIGMKTFRLIHYTSLIGYLGATLHGIFAGTDSSLPVAMLMYTGTFLVIVFLIMYWLLMIWLSKRPQTATVKIR
jgi:sulfoxide reductase heme-binding subunit YedZ